MSSSVSRYISRGRAAKSIVSRYRVGRYTILDLADFVVDVERGYCSSKRNATVLYKQLYID